MVLTAVSILLLARPIVLLSDPNACVPRDYRQVVPAWVGLPAEVEGRILPPIPGDPNIWEVPRGEFSRTARACDPDGDPFTVTFISGTSPATVSLNLQDGTWTLRATVGKGLNQWSLRADDGEDSQVFAVVCVGENLAPVLE